MVAVGSDIFIEEKPERTIERLKGQIEEVRKSLQSLNDQRAEALRRYQAIVQSVNSSQKQDVS